MNRKAQHAGRETKLPRKCECGGKLVYTRDFGQWFVYCKKCTPVVKINAPR